MLLFLFLSPARPLRQLPPLPSGRPAAQLLLPSGGHDGAAVHRLRWAPVRPRGEGLPVRCPAGPPGARLGHEVPGLQRPEAARLLPHLGWQVWRRLPGVSWWVVFTCLGRVYTCEGERIAQWLELLKLQTTRLQVQIPCLFVLWREVSASCCCFLLSGDPLRFHAHFIAVCLDLDESLPLSDVLTVARLGSNVKKTVLLCSPAEEEVLYTSLQWSGMI